LSASADLVEVFSSVQGEGTHVGERTIFVRFGGCDLRCRWCDSPHTWRPSLECRLETPGGGSASVPNPVDLGTVLGAVRDLGASQHRFVSLTGGEPLLQPEAACEFARALRALGPRILLETHGAAPDAFRAVVDAVDVVSMDWKLASDVRRASDPAKGPVRGFEAEHRLFLEIARTAPETVLKLVVTLASTDEEIDAALAAVKEIHPAAVVVFQPVAPGGGAARSPTARRLLDLASRGASLGLDVRVIPQLHKLLGVR
jgi:organic radical activating enzyme